MRSSGLVQFNDNKNGLINFEMFWTQALTAQSRKLSKEL